MTTPQDPNKQLSIKDDGQIYWQPDPTNPLPGVPVARVVKGETALAPVVEMLPELGLQDEALEAALAPIRDWMVAYTARVLEPLVKLAMVIEGTPEPVQKICDAVYAGLGIVPREDVADLIAQLDTETRKTLRGRHVRLGPVLVFIPDLNKPAAVRLRALLWSLWNDKPLPAPTPRDGAVSQVVDVTGADPAFYRAIGYPLYANRVIRIDMLDRVMNAVYESVKDNTFRATHQMAEWLGCSVPDLYLVLEAMGHKKVSDPAAVAPTPADQVEAQALVAVVPVEEGTESIVSSEPTESETIENVAAIKADVSDPAPVDGAEASVSPPAKPELATFKVWWPKKGGTKPAREPRVRGPRKPRAAVKDKTPPAFDYLSPEEIEARKAQDAERRENREKRFGAHQDGGHRDDRGPRKGPGEGAGKPVGRNVGGRGPGGGTGFGGGSKQNSKPVKLDKGLRLVSSAPAPAPKPEDSPFAALMALKLKSE
jgi:ATP-dependent RNA helicase SUPV3L1/SUV3